MRLLPLLLMLGLAAATPIQLSFLWPSPSPSSPRLNSTSTRVPLTLGVMSKCPDAEICETVMDRVLDTHTGGIAGGGRDEVVGDLVDLALVFIAKEQKNETYGVSCMHGELECKGNVQQLCAIEHWGKEVNKTNEGDAELRTTRQEKKWGDWWDFIQCMNYGPRSRIGDRAAAKECASVVGRDWNDEMHRCVATNGTEGAHLLRHSLRAAQSLGITRSCTVMLNGRKICIHDGVWKDCDAGHEVGDFVRQITDEWKKLNPKEREVEDAAGEAADLDEEEEDEWELV
ncbi:hypothetical protein JCM1840_006069 [Sporobolomyces johnsonii]